MSKRGAGKWGRRGGGGNGGKGGGAAKKARHSGGGIHGAGGWSGHPGALNLKGRPAIIATCDAIQTKYAKKELLNMLGEYADEIFPVAAAPLEGTAATNGTAPPPALTVSEMMKLEVKAQRKNRASRRVSVLQLGIKGLIVVRIDDDAICPVRLVRAIFEDLERTGRAKTRFCCRLIPLSCMCKADADEIFSVALPLVRAHFGAVAAAAETEAKAQRPAAKKKKQKKKKKKGGEVEVEGSAGVEDAASASAMSTVGGKTGRGKHFAVQIKRRSNTSVEKMPLIERIAAEVGMHHTVNLSSPESVVVVEVLKGLAGVAVVEGYTRFKGFNLHAMVPDDGLDEVPL